MSVAVYGSATLLTSVANEEIIPDPPLNWDIGYSFYKFEMLNDMACTIKANGSDPVYIRSGQGFKTVEGDAPIKSFVIVEDGVTFNWIGHTY